MVATLMGTAESQPAPTCEGCAFDLTALEEFTVDFQTVTYLVSFDNPYFSHDQSSDDDDGDYRPRLPTGLNFETSPLPPSFPSDHGTLALHARNLQLKFDNHATFPAHFVFGDGYQHHSFGPPPVNLPLGDLVEIHEELHINGANRQASYHLESSVLNVCFQVDLPSSIPVSQAQSLVDDRLGQAEQMAPMLIQQHGMRAKVNGQEAVGFVDMGEDGLDAPPAVLFTNTSQPAFISLPVGRVEAQQYQQFMQPVPDTALLKHLALKFDNYANTVGSAFAVRACEIESHSATQSVLASNPAAREFIVNRIAQHQRHLQALLEPEMLNTRFNFIPLEISDAMFPVEQPCTADELVQMPSTLSNFQMLVFVVGSFAMGMAATFGVLRRKLQMSADDYHQVSA
jgi:hypothetical protein